MFYAHSGSVASRNGHSGMIRPTPRQGHPQAGISVKLLSADGSASGPVEKLSCMQHTVHDDGKFASDRHGCSLEAETFPQSDTPLFQSAFARRTRQDHDSGLVKQAAEARIS